MAKRIVLIAAFVVLAAWAKPAFPNAEPPAIYDTRSVSMGGTGAATANSPAAIFHNTAGLGEIDSLSVSLTFTPYFIQLNYPWLTGAGYPETTSSERTVGPLGFLGLGVRVHDRVVLGLGAFLTAGLGAKYKSVEALGGQDAEMGAFAGEIQLPFVYQINNELTLGAAYRMSFAIHQMKMPMPDQQDPPELVETEMSTVGFDFVGFQFGILYKPTKNFRLGVNYRSPVVVEMKGETKAGGVTVEKDTKVDYELPHSIKIGAACSYFEDALTLAADFNYWMYSRSHEEYGWRDAITLNLGAEYWVNDMVPIRMGTFIGRSATSEAATNPFVPAEGPTLGATLGSGVRLGGWDIDLGLAFVWASSDIEVANPQGGGSTRHMNSATMPSWRLCQSATECKEQGNEKENHYYCDCGGRAVGSGYRCSLLSHALRRRRTRRTAWARVSRLQNSKVG
jgi:long-chain fatty acid transport protein